MDVVHIVAYGMLIILALLVARGVYLIGSGREVEHQARSMSVRSGVLASGWMALDALRNFDHPALLKIEELFGVERGGPTVYVHERCGSTNVTKRGAGWYCYECQQQTTAVQEVSKQR
jgi:hypothetical protein